MKKKDIDNFARQIYHVEKFPEARAVPWETLTREQKDVWRIRVDANWVALRNAKRGKKKAVEKNQQVLDMYEDLLTRYKRLLHETAPVLIEKIDKYEAILREVVVPLAKKALDMQFDHNPDSEKVFGNATYADFQRILLILSPYPEVTTPKETPHVQL